MICRHFLTSVVVLMISNATLGDDSLGFKDISVTKAILGLNSQDKKVRSKSIEKLTRETEDIWESNPYSYDIEGDQENVKFLSEVKPHIKHLTIALKSNNTKVISTAALVLAKLGSDAQHSLSTLQKLFQNQCTPLEARTHIFIALLHVTPKEKPLGPILIKFLDSLPNQYNVEFNKLSNEARKAPFSGIRIANASIVYSSLFIGANRTVVEIPYLVKVTSPKYPLIIRAISISILGHFQSDAESALPELQKLLLDKEKLIQISAALAMIRIRKESNKIPSLLKALKLNRKEEIEFRKSIGILLKEKQKLADLPGSDDADVIQELIKMTKNDNGFYKRQAIIALGQIGSTAGCHWFYQCGVMLLCQKTFD